MAKKRTSESERVVSSAAAVPARRKSTTAVHKKHASTQPETVLAKPAPVPAPAASHEPTREEIALLAYSYWQARGYQNGDSAADWIRAEGELRARAPARAIV